MKRTEPSKQSLDDIPEVDFGSVRRLRRGKYAQKARRSFAIALLDPEVFAQFGSSEAVNAALKALLDAAESIKPPVSAGRRGHTRKKPAA